MPRAPFQVLVFPFRLTDDGSYEYALFKRRDLSCWQGISGGGEEGESAIEAAVRETFEESGIPADARWVELESRCSIPVESVCGFLWGNSVLLLTEHSFGVRVDQDREIVLSEEHSEVRWCGYSDAVELLRWDSNRTALWELDYRLSEGLVAERD